jgi:catechol 2,3-dioxygenase-like lactoylglutathione lyase family enzyme
MASKFDRIVLAVPELSAAVAQYRQLLGLSPFTHESPQGGLVAWWGLPNTVIELVQSVIDQPRLQGIVFSAPDAAALEKPVGNPLGVDIRLGDGQRTTGFRLEHPAAQCTGFALDHIVLRTDDAQACIDLFAGELGIRLALDKAAPAWGGRMLFFRAGKLTLEVIEGEGDAKSGNAFWGLAYQCQDLAGTLRTLGERGIAFSAMREGRKPGTLVATLKSHHLGIPTLLIQPAESTA